MIPEPFINDVLSRVDVVAVVERAVRLKKSGANYSACCPFHNEKSPSFTVSPTKQFFHCFGCGAHGNAIGFLMQYFGMSYVDAIEDLARGLGLQVPNDSTAKRTAKVEHKDQQSLVEWMTQATQFYRDQLKKSPQAISYLKQRGFTGEIAAQFRIGYAPSGWQSLAKIFSQYDHPALLECGLVQVNAEGRRYDRFRERIMFPILNAKGEVIAFGGRQITENAATGPKYLNSPETPIFEKGKEIYGLPQARLAIRQQNCVIVVEGYMDVVALAQFGVNNVVATLGTATTNTHIQSLLRLADRAIFCFDHDTAGDNAAWRAIQNALPFITEQKRVDVLQLPGEMDPDEYVRKFGADKFQELAKAAAPASQFITRTLTSACPPGTVEGKMQFLHRLKPLLQSIRLPILQHLLADDVAQVLKLGREEILDKCSIAREKRPFFHRTLKPAASTRRAAIHSLEFQLLCAVLDQPQRAQKLPLDLITCDQVEGMALLAIADAMEEGKISNPDTEDVIQFFKDSPHAETLNIAWKALQEGSIERGNWAIVFADTLARLSAKGVQIRIKELNSKAAQGTLMPADALELRALLKRKHNTRAEN